MSKTKLRQCKEPGCLTWVSPPYSLCALHQFERSERWRQKAQDLKPRPVTVNGLDRDRAGADEAVGEQ
jgi:hypothetical protein